MCQAAGVSAVINIELFFQQSFWFSWFFQFRKLDVQWLYDFAEINAL